MLTLAAIALTLAGSDWKGYEPDPRFPYLSPVLNIAYRERIHWGYPDDGIMGRGRPRSRYEYAVTVHAIVTTGIRMSEEALSKPGNDVERASLLRFGTTLPSFALAVKEFRKELDSLGVEKEFGLAELNRLLVRIKVSSLAKDRLFSDVPVDHWAAKAVGDLRALEMLQGYMDGKFRG